MNQLNVVVAVFVCVGAFGCGDKKETAGGEAKGGAEEKAGGEEGKAGGEEGKAGADYIAKSKATEAKVMLKKIYDGARMYYLDAPGGGGMVVSAPQFPASVEMTPAKGACCTDGMTKCAPNAPAWENPTWMALMFSMDDPHYYSYEFKSSGEGPGATFTVRAVGDLDCDGTFATFELKGVAGEDGPGSAGEITETNPTE